METRVRMRGDDILDCRPGETAAQQAARNVDAIGNPEALHPRVPAWPQLVMQLDHLPHPGDVVDAVVARELVDEAHRRSQVVPPGGEQADVVQGPGQRDVVRNLFQAKQFQLVVQPAVDMVAVVPGTS